MIHYQLRCPAEHSFDGWFRDSAAFDLQARDGLLSCPVCGVRQVTRALMAPVVGKRRLPPAQVDVPSAPPADPAPQAVAAGKLPDGLRALLQRMRADVEKQCDYVGGRFAEEARRMHNGEVAERGIYGETTPEEAERLADDGIDVARIPWVPRADG